MRKKEPKVVYTPNKFFDCKRPLGWDEIVRYLTIAVDSYNREKRANYKVEAQAVGDPKIVEIYKTMNHHKIWIEDTLNKRMHFSLLCKKNSDTNSFALQDGVKYNRFILISEDTSIKWLDKKNDFLHEFIPFIRREVSYRNC